MYLLLNKVSVRMALVLLYFNLVRNRGMTELDGISLTTAGV